MQNYFTINCIPDCTNCRCVNCGWRWKYPERPWPHRNCTNPPELRPAADALGLPDPLPPNMAQHIATWIMHGDTPPDELAARDTICVMCDHKTPLGQPVFNETDRCNSKAKGCGGSGYRPPLQVMQRLPTFRCPAGKWPEDQSKLSSSDPSQQLPISSA